MEGGEAAYLNINIKKRAAAARPIDTLQPLGISTRHRVVTRSRGHYAGRRIHSGQCYINHSITARILPQIKAQQRKGRTMIIKFQTREEQRKALFWRKLAQAVKEGRANEQTIEFILGLPNGDFQAYLDTYIALGQTKKG